MPQHAAEGALEVGLREDLRGRPRRQHRAVEQHHLIAEVRHAAEIVGGDQHQVAGRAQFAQQRDDRRLGLHVDAGERLVEQDDASFLRQRAGEKHALLLSAGEFADLAVAKSLMPTRSSAASTL